MASPFGIFNPLLKVTCGVQFPLSTCDDLINITFTMTQVPQDIYGLRNQPLGGAYQVACAFTNCRARGLKL